MRIRNLVLASIVGAAAFSQSASAAIVNFKINVDAFGPGTFSVTATDSTGDNFGISGFAVTFSGTSGVTPDNLTNDAPVATYKKSSTTKIIGLGATDATSSMQLGGGQNSTQGAVFMIDGIGQGVVNWPASISSGGTWALQAGSSPIPAEVLIGDGIYTGTFASNWVSGVAANVWTAAASTNAAAATATFSVVTVPEPALLGAVVLYGGIMAMRRRKA